MHLGYRAHSSKILGGAAYHPDSLVVAGQGKRRRQTNIPTPNGVRDFDSGQSPDSIDGMKCNMGETEIFVKIEFEWVRGPFGGLGFRLLVRNHQSQSHNS
jgi:hypothetical protein